MNIPIFHAIRPVIDGQASWMMTIAMDGVLVGCCRLVDVGREVEGLRDVFVVEGRRGKGLGEALVKEALRYARSDGAGAVSALVTHEMARWYTGMGWEAVGTDDGKGTDGVPRVAMVKRF